jgi:fatty acid desaturase
MLRSQSIHDVASVAFTLDARRARLRRRRRRDAIREWAGLAVVATVGVWLAAVVLLSFVAH